MYMRWVRATPPVDSGMGWGAGTVLLTLLLILLPSGDLGHQLDRPLVQVATSRATSRQTRSGTAIKTIASARQDSFSGRQGGLLPLPPVGAVPDNIGSDIVVNKGPKKEKKKEFGSVGGVGQQSIPDATCQTEYTDIFGGDLNDGRLPGQKTRSPKQCQQRCQETPSAPTSSSLPPPCVPLPPWQACPKVNLNWLLPPLLTECGGIPTEFGHVRFLLPPDLWPSQALSPEEEKLPFSANSRT